MNRFRQKRFRQFFRILGVSNPSTILDVGGLPYDWIDLDYTGRVICVSLSAVHQGRWGKGNIRYYNQDALALPYADNGIEVVYSNSLLEHVGRENQAAVANEIRRVAQRYWVQVPNRHFVLEPHYRALFFYQMPLWGRKWVASRWTPLVNKKNPYLAEVETIYPLDKQEMQALFPEATVIQEKFMGLTKSLIAVKQ
jgi:ubiquinone/menaquinone biosynthesis C-methylase UbiE